MALIKCSECGKEVSDKATVCINCGCPIKQERKCNECGNILNDNATVCNKCGCPINTIQQNNNAQISNYNTIPSQNNGQINSYNTIPPQNNYAQLNNQSKNVNTFALCGMIVGIISFFIDFWGLVAATGLTLSIVGYVKSTNHRDKAFAIVGIVLSGLELIFKIIQIINLLRINIR